MNPSRTSGYAPHFLPRWLPILVCALVLSAACTPSAFSQLPKPEPPRGWKTAEGAAFNATLMEFDGKTAVLRMPTGQRAQAALEKLSAADQTYLAEWMKRQPVKVVMPDVVGVETANMKAEVVSEDAAND